MVNHNAPGSRSAPVVLTGDEAEAQQETGLAVPIHPLVLQAIERSKAENTREAYRIQWTKFVRWARSRRIPELPARPQDIALYLAELSGNGSALSTIQLARAAISHAHKLTGMGIKENPARSGLVSETLKGIAQDAAPPKQARALLPRDLDAIRRTARLPRAGRGGRQEMPETARKRGNMDLALCLVLRDAGLRGSECAALVWARPRGMGGRHGPGFHPPLQDQPDRTAPGGLRNPAHGPSTRRHPAGRAQPGRPHLPHHNQTDHHQGPARRRTGGAGDRFQQPFRAGGAGQKYGRQRCPDQHDHASGPMEEG